MLKIGIYGVGHLGKIHIQRLQEMNTKFNLVGFIDPSEDAANYAQHHFGITRFLDQDDFVQQCDAVLIAAPTTCHFELAAHAIKRSKHVFIEKPVTVSVEEAKTLLTLATEAGVLVQVGHVERFNPAYLGALPYIHKPMFIETHRMAEFNVRGTDVSVIHDLMIHDIDIVLNCVNSSVRKTSVNGVSVVSSTPDIANARIEFENGCVANFTASRISQFNQRKMRIFQNGNYIGIDFLNRDFELLSIDRNLNSNISVEKPTVIQNNAIQEELLAFYTSIVHQSPIVVSLDHAVQSLQLVEELVEKLKRLNLSN